MNQQPRLRADAVRNSEQIRRAAEEVFRLNGLTAGLDEVARAAGVAKGTVYHRFGGRPGLVDAVIGTLAAQQIDGLLAEVDLICAPLERFEAFLLRLWLLQYDHPAVNDVMLRSVPDCPVVIELSERVITTGRRHLQAARTADRVSDDVLDEDLCELIRERGVAARGSDQSAREGYQRRCRHLIRGLRHVSVADPLTSDRPG